jgi:hypothetical protein
MRYGLIAFVLAVCSCTNAVAQTPRGSTTEADHTFARAGFSNWIAPWAKPSPNPKEMPGVIGGSRPHRGEGPVAATEGVFGYDYVGYGQPSRVFLGWTHDPVNPRMGSYRTDGPRVFDIFSIHPVRKALSPGGHE